MTVASTFALSATLALLLILVSPSSVAPAAAAAAGGREGAELLEAGESAAVTSSSSSSDLDAEVLTSLRHFCRSLHDLHHPYLAFRAAEMYEAALHRRALELAQHLEDAREAHKHQDHNHFSCADARAVMDHSTAREFLSYFSQLMGGELRGRPAPSGLAEPHTPNAQLISNVRQLRSALHESGLVNEDVLHELDDIVADLDFHAAAFDELKQQRDLVALATPTTETTEEEEGECRRAFAAFVGKLHDLHQEHIPNWQFIDEGVVSLIQQCAEDPAVLALDEL